MIDSFAFSEVVRKLANLIRLGKISEVKDNLVKVKIGKVTTNWLPIVSQAGNTSVWVPITVGEQVAVFSPYGESAQAFVLRSINYDSFKTPENLEDVVFKTDARAMINGAKDTVINFDNGIEIRSDNALISLKNSEITLKSGNSEIKLSDTGITLSYSRSTINLNDSSIALSSGSISTNPSVCKCTGGL